MRDVRWIDAHGTRFRDHSLSGLRDVREIEMLKLTGSNIRDESLAPLRTIGSIEDLYVADTAITDKGLDFIGDIPGLRVVCLDGTNTSRSAIDRVQRKRPDVTFVKRYDFGQNTDVW